jgi:hypothetical protein
MADAINVGDVRRLSVAITDASTAPVDPTTLRLLIRKPDQSLTTYTYLNPDAVIVRESEGNYHADIPLDIAGAWKYDWEGSGAATFAEGSTFNVFLNKTNT